MPFSKVRVNKSNITENNSNANQISSRRNTPVSRSSCFYVKNQSSCFLLELNEDQKQVTGLQVTSVLEGVASSPGALSHRCGSPEISIHSLGASHHITNTTLLFFPASRPSSLWKSKAAVITEVFYSFSIPPEVLSAFFFKL